MPKVYGFNDRETAEALASMVRRAPRRVRKPTAALRPPVASGGGSPMIHFQSPAGGIPARVGLQMGSAICDVMDCNGTGLLSDSSSTEEIFNNSTAVFQELTQGTAIKNTAGIYVAVFENCEEDDLLTEEPEGPGLEEPPPP